MTTEEFLNTLANMTEDDISGFKKRNLQDTQYISRFLLNFLKKYLQLAPRDDFKDILDAIDSFVYFHNRRK